MKELNLTEKVSKQDRPADSNWLDGLRAIARCSNQWGEKIYVKTAHIEYLHGSYGDGKLQSVAFKWSVVRKGTCPYSLLLPLIFWTVSNVSTSFTLMWILGDDAEEHINVHQAQSFDCFVIFYLFQNHLYLT